MFMFLMFNERFKIFPFKRNLGVYTPANSWNKNTEQKLHGTISK